jgi:inosine-uridine nucleoside N-ribohydrolase
MPQKIIIDTDPGVDDSMAIFFALCSPELDVVGLTTIFGNVHTSLATTNALRLLEIAGRPDIPVAKGADDPLARPYKGPVPYVHGDDGQGNIGLPPPTHSAVPMTAAEFIIDRVMAHPGEITLVGPLTNIALALRLEPRIAENVREVVIMGGNAFCQGNASPAAEANILNDAEAADVVFGAAWKVTMVGLDVTHKVHMSSAHLAEYGRIDNAMAQHIHRIVPHYVSFFEATYHNDGIFVHDSSAVAYVIDPSLFTCVQAPVRVDTDSGVSRGKTWPNMGARILPPWENRPLVNIPVAVDSPRLVEMELNRIRAGN